MWASVVCVSPGTATGRKGSMWAAVPAAAACDAATSDEDGVPLGPGQLPPRNAHLPPLHAEINISIIMIKGQLELEVKCSTILYTVLGSNLNTPICCVHFHTLWRRLRKSHFCFTLYNLLQHCVPSLWKDAASLCALYSKRFIIFSATIIF